jgi:outer membrane receptor protein involved in Fe transport
VPEEARGAVEAAVTQSLIDIGQAGAAFGLSRLPSGLTAVVLSLGNAGEVDEKGLEMGASWQASEHLRLDGNYTLFSFQVDSSTVVPGDQVLPNTPEHKVKLSAAVETDAGLDFRVDSRFISAYDWASGIFAGPVPSGQTVDVTASYQLTPSIRVHGVATNVFDQRRFQLYGGSVLGRRILTGLSVEF